MLKGQRFIVREKLGRLRWDMLRAAETAHSILFSFFSYLCESCPFNEIIELPHSSLLGETLDILEEILCLGFEESPVLCVPQRMRPEGADVDPQHLRCVDHLPQGPHQSTIDPHQLLCVHLVSLVEHHSNLVILAPE